MTCALKLRAMLVAAFGLAKLLDLPPLAAGAVVLFAAMPTGANSYKYQRLVNPVVGCEGAGDAAGGDDVASGAVGGGGRDVAPRRHKLGCWVYGARHDQSKASILTLA